MWCAMVLRPIFPSYKYKSATSCACEPENEAQRSRAPMQKLADRVAGVFVPAVVLASVLAFAGWMWLGPQPRLAHALVAAVSVLIIACPCALGLATPMSIMVAVGRGASLGILVRNAEALETLARVDTLVVDKTGTLTEGRPEVRSVELVPGETLTENELLAMVASAERGSEHPLARAIVRAAEARNLILDNARDFESIAGKGVRALVNGQTVLAGTAKFLVEQGIAVAADALGSNADGHTYFFVGVNGKFAGTIGLADTIKATTAAALQSLRL